MESELDELRSKILKLEKSFDPNISVGSNGTGASTVGSSSTTSTSVPGSVTSSVSPNNGYAPHHGPLVNGSLNGSFNVPNGSNGTVQNPYDTVGLHYERFPSAYGNSYLPPPIRKPLNIHEGHFSAASSDSASLPDRDRDRDAPYESCTTTSSNSNEDQAEPNSDYLSPEIKRLLAKEDYDFNLYHGYSTIVETDGVRVGFGPLSYKGIMKVDNATFLIWDEIYTKLREKVHKAKDQTEFSKQCRDACSQAFKFGNYSINDAVRDGAMTLGLYTNSPFNETMGLIAKVEMVLPTRKVIWKLIDNFFVYLYPCFPFLDEVDFRNQVSRLIGDERIEVKPIVRNEKKIDFAFIGILLIVVRLSYLSLFSTLTQINEMAFKSEDPDPKVQEKKYLLNNPVTVESFHIAQQCFKSFNLFNVTDFPVFQLGLFCYVYRIWGPEFGIEPDNTELNGLKCTLFQLAYSLGLNREPTKFNSGVFKTNVKVDNLGRKMWGFLHFADVLDGYLIGNPLLSKTYASDTYKPFFTIENSNLIDVKKEQFVVESTASAQTLCTKYFASFIRDLLDLNGTQKVSKIINSLELIEQEYDKPNGIFRNLLHDPKNNYNNGFTALLKFKIQLDIKYSTVSIYVHLFNFFEKRGNYELQYYCLMKILNISFKVLPQIINVIEEDNLYNFLIIPAMETILHKNMVIIYAMLLRIKLNYQTLWSSNDDMGLYQTLERSLMTTMDLHAKIVEPLAKRYFYSWFIYRCFTCSKILYEQVTNPEIVLQQKHKLQYPMFKDHEKMYNLHVAVEGINLELLNSKFPSNKNWVNDDQLSSSVSAASASATANNNHPTNSNGNNTENESNDMNNNNNSNNYNDTMFSNMLGSPGIAGDLLEDENLERLWNHLDNMRSPHESNFDLSVVNDILKGFDTKV